MKTTTDHVLFEVAFVTALILVTALLLTAAMAFDGFKKAEGGLLDDESAARRRQMAVASIGVGVVGLVVLSVAFILFRGAAVKK